MVITCSAPGCSAKKDGIGNKGIIQFHRFPLKKQEICAKWIKAMRSPNFRPSNTSYLCSAHFLNSDYESKASQNGKILKSLAVPSVFERRKPGRKKKALNTSNTITNNTGKLEDNSRLMESKTDEPSIENKSKIESHLADIIGDREKGTLQVLIVGEDGKITNSEYIFKKQLFSSDDCRGGDDDNVGDGDDGSDDDDDDDDDDDGGNNDNGYSLVLNKFMSEKSKNAEIYPTEVNEVDSLEIGSANCSTPLCILKMKRLESKWNWSRKKLKFLQMKCKKINNQNKELKLLLKLLILKKGRGEKSLNQLLEDYEGYEYGTKLEVKEEELYGEN